MAAYLSRWRHACLVTMVIVALMDSLSCQYTNSDQKLPYDRSNAINDRRRSSQSAIVALDKQKREQPSKQPTQPSDWKIPRIGKGKAHIDPHRSSLRNAHANLASYREGRDDILVRQKPTKQMNELNLSRQNRLKRTNEQSLSRWKRPEGASGQRLIRKKRPDRNNEKRLSRQKRPEIEHEGLNGKQQPKGKTEHNSSRRQPHQRNNKHILLKQKTHAIKEEHGSLRQMHELSPGQTSSRRKRDENVVKERQMSRVRDPGATSGESWLEKSETRLKPERALARQKRI